jgi:hypothetical protein
VLQKFLRLTADRFVNREQAVRSADSTKSFSFSGLACEALTAPLFGTIPAVHAPEAGPLFTK